MKNQDLLSEDKIEFLKNRMDFFFQQQQKQQKMNMNKFKIATSNKHVTFVNLK